VDHAAFDFRELRHSSKTSAEVSFGT
jgi:hypothetical protein